MPDSVATTAPLAKRKRMGGLQLYVRHIENLELKASLEDVTDMFDGSAHACLNHTVDRGGKPQTQGHRSTLRPIHL